MRYSSPSSSCELAKSCFWFFWVCWALPTSGTAVTATVTGSSAVCTPYPALSSSAKICPPQFHKPFLFEGREWPGFDASYSKIASEDQLLLDCEWRINYTDHRWARGEEWQQTPHTALWKYFNYGLHKFLFHFLDSLKQRLPTVLNCLVVCWGGNVSSVD